MLSVLSCTTPSLDLQRFFTRTISGIRFKNLGLETLERLVRYLVFTRDSIHVYATVRICYRPSVRLSVRRVMDHTKTVEDRIMKLALW